MYHPKWNISTLIKNPQLCPRKSMWKRPHQKQNTTITQEPQQPENIKNLKKKVSNSKKIIKALEQPLQYREMGLPISQIKSTKRSCPKRNILTLLKNPQICPSNWKTSKVCRKSKQNLKKLLKHYSNPCSIGKKVFQCPKFKYSKRPRP